MIADYYGHVETRLQEYSQNGFKSTVKTRLYETRVFWIGTISVAAYLPLKQYKKDLSASGYV